MDKVKINKAIDALSLSFDNKNILKEVSHHIWFCCAASALLNRNYTIFRRAFKCIPNKISVVEMLSLFKRFLIGLLIK